MDPVQSAAQVAGQGGQLLGRECSTVGEGLAAVHAGPEAAVGETIMGIGAAYEAEEFALGDVAHQAEVSGGSLEQTMVVVGSEIAAVPGAAEQRGELSGIAAEDMEDGGELL